ncbi:MAG: hypothetical protein PHH08_04490 [Candidatus ainarchaeum sp.]|nr:hypothetical protein [Candidatus ainarchaeum sp.]
MLLLVFVLVYVTSTILPTIDWANSSAEEIARIGNAKIASQKLAGAIDEISIAPGNARATIKLFVDEKSSIDCNFSPGGQRKIDFNAEMILPDAYNPYDRNCSAIAGRPVVCTGDTPVSAPQSVAVTCRLDAGSAIINGKRFADVIIEKDSLGTVLVKYA